MNAWFLFKMSKSVALLYYANIDHYSINTSMHNYLLHGGYLELLSSAKVPINVCFTGMTLEKLIEYDPMFIKKIQSLQNVKFFYTSYSHFLPSEFPKDIISQSEFGEKIIKEVIPDSKLMNIISMPEYDCTETVLNKIYTSNQFLISSSIINHGSLGSCKVCYKHLGTDKLLYCIHKDLMYRKRYHEYLREECKAKDVVSAIKSDLLQMKQNKVLICAIDLETPVINQVVFDNHKSSPPRLDLVKRLYDEYLKSKFRFVYLDEVSSLSERDLSIVDSLTNVDITVRKNPVYNNVLSRLKRINTSKLNINLRHYLMCTSSDLYTYSHRRIKLPATYKAKKGLVIIYRSGLKKSILKHRLQKIGINILT